jgi:predicted DNA-binding transcriptional regulator YafY
MKYRTMIKILLLLLSKRKTTAKEIAERFEISTRSAYRYLDELSMAGVPIYSERGRYGGICIADTYKLPVGFFTRAEYAAAINALKAMTFQVDDEDLLSALEKLERQVKNERQDMSVCGNILVDSSSWNGGHQFSEKMHLCEQAVNECRSIQIDYISREGEHSKRIVDPYVLIYKQNVWYLYAFCHTKKDFRTFKIGRIRSANLTESTFYKKEVKRADIPLSFTYSEEQLVSVTLSIDKSALPEVEDWLGVENIEPFGNNLRAQLQLYNDGTLVNKILSFGKAVTVLEPANLKEQVKEAAMAVGKLYE